MKVDTQDTQQDASPSFNFLEKLVESVPATIMNTSTDLFQVCEKKKKDST